jgi:hypothetical protein
VTRRVALSGSLVAVLLGVAFGDEFKSGLEIGDFAIPFDVRNITGQDCAVSYAKDTRTSLCYR